MIEKRIFIHQRLLIDKEKDRNLHFSPHVRLAAASDDGQLSKVTITRFFSKFECSDPFDMRAP